METALNSLQHEHQNAVNDCLNLKYKNSVLERIMLEKGKISSFSSLSESTDNEFSSGINVQAELRAKEMPLSTSTPPQLAQPRPTFLARKHVQRSNSGSLPRPVHSSNGSVGSMSLHSPRMQPTPVSTMSSPSINGSRLVNQAKPPSSHMQFHQTHQQQTHSPRWRTSFAEVDRPMIQNGEHFLENSKRTRVFCARI
jgi:hypothetical protein